MTNERDKHPNVYINLIESLPVGHITEAVAPARLFFLWDNFRTIKAQCHALACMVRVGDRVRVVFGCKGRPPNFGHAVAVFMRRSGRIVRTKYNSAHVVELELVSIEHRK